MLKDNTKLSLAILLLNDLLKNKAIDEDIYNKAVKRINAKKQEKPAA